MDIWTITVLIILHLCQTIYAGKHDENKVEICSSSSGKLQLSNSDPFIAHIPDDSKPTLFVQDSDEYIFKCMKTTSLTNGNLLPEISFEGVVNGSIQSVSTPRDMHRSTIKRLTSENIYTKNRLNKEPLTVACKLSGKIICTSWVIVLTPPILEPECEYNNTLITCSVDDIDTSIIKKKKEEKPIDTEIRSGGGILQGAARTTPSPHYFDMVHSFGRALPSSTPSPATLTTTQSQETPTKRPEIGAIKYSIFENNKWVYCDELNEEGEIIHPALIGSLLPTMAIRCNIKPKPKPYIIRIEQYGNSKLAAGIPLNNIKVEYTYFSIQINDTTEFFPTNNNATNTENMTGGNSLGELEIVLLSVFTIVALIIVLVALIFTKLHPSCKYKTNKGPSKVYIQSSTENIRDELTSIDTKRGQQNPIYEQDKQKDMASISNEEYALQDKHKYSYGVSYHKENEERLLTDTSEFCDLEEMGWSNNEEKVEFRKTILARQLSGDPTKVNPKIALNSQAKVMTYNPKLEIDRSNFVVKKMLGAGHFGSVYEGDAAGLFYPDSKTQVAVKTVNDPLDGSQRTALLCEIKILSNLELHLNLVNMMGSCTSEFVNSGEFFMLLEYCEKGDMKKFLNKHHIEFVESLDEKHAKEELSNRLLLQWAFHIAKGMQYLARMHIMHGDLAARNILIGKGDDGNGGSSNLVAKVSDFGLSKTFYDNIRYKKQDRHYVPWKWMALEYLQTGHLTITSDVWSYGVVLWEIFSFGKEPYVGKNADDMVSKFKNGYYLPCPEDSLKIKCWSSETIYNKLAKMCFVSDPMKRATFSDIVEQLESDLSDDEMTEYCRQTDQYASMSSLISDPNTQLKRSSINPNNLEACKSSDASYLIMTQGDKNTQIEPRAKEIHNESGNKFTNGNTAIPPDNMSLAKTRILGIHNTSNTTCVPISREAIIAETFGHQGVDCDTINIINDTPMHQNVGEIPNCNTGYITVKAANESMGP